MSKTGQTAKRPGGTTAAKRTIATEQRRLGDLHAEAVAAAWAAYDLARDEAARIRRAALELADRNYRDGLAEALAMLRPPQDQESEPADERQRDRAVFAQDALRTVGETLDPNQALGGSYTPRSGLSPDTVRQERTR